MENLDDNYLGGYDFVNDDEVPLPARDGTENHGTQIASLAVGEGMVRVIGVAYNASYYSCKVLIDDSSGGWLSDILAGIAWASQEPHKADIISMSLIHYGGGILWPHYGPLIHQACDNAYAQGVLLVGGSGNEGYDYSGFPAAFNSVISVGVHAEDSSLWDDEHGKSNGGVDVLAPGAEVYSAGADDYGYLCWGTSGATPHVAGLIALQLQFAREKGMEVNNGYIWETLRHSAIDLGIDPVYQGKGKIWGAETDPPPATPHDGSIDLMNAGWPIADAYAYPGSFTHEDCPAFYIGTTAHQDITLTNITDEAGNTIETIENLEVTAAQISFGGPNEPNLPGDSVTVFATIDRLAPGDANSVTLQLSYEISPGLAPGLNQTKVTFEFNFAGDDRLINLGYRAADSLWRAAMAMPGDTNLDNTVDLADFAAFAAAWKTSDCNGSNICCKGDIDQSGGVDYNDLRILVENWLYGIAH